MEEAFEEQYPNIDLIGHDISSTEQITRLKAEADSGAETAELVGWDEDRVAVTVEGPDCVGEARLVDPSTGAAHELGRAHGLRLVDSWQGSALVRLGPRGDRHLRLLP